MIAAIYARKSTEQTGVADHEKSVTRHIAHATDYAAGPKAPHWLAYDLEYTSARQTESLTCPHLCVHIQS